MVVILMGVLAVIAMAHYEKTAHEARKTALRAELLNLRQSIALFKAIKGRQPDDLKELLTGQYVLPYKDDLINRKYLEPGAVDERMNILDPFGLPYLYFPADGSVRSQKDGYEYY